MARFLKASSPQDDGYASVSALVLVASLAVVSAALLTRMTAERRLIASEMGAAQIEEDVNAAILDYGVTLAGQTSLEAAPSTIAAADGRKIALVAESEAQKWPLKLADQVSDVEISHKTRLPPEALRIAAAAELQGHADGRVWPKDECVRRFFSPFGQVKPGDTLQEAHALGNAQVISKDGQIWRIRAKLGARIEERLVRFTGDVRVPLAIVAQGVHVETKEPSCGI